MVATIFKTIKLKDKKTVYRQDQCCGAETAKKLLPGAGGVTLVSIQYFDNLFLNTVYVYFLIPIISPVSISSCSGVI
jgi:hypothetical protein